MNGFFAVEDDLNLKPVPKKESSSLEKPVVEPVVESVEETLNVDDADDPVAAWDRFFASHAPSPKAVRAAVRDRSNQKRYDAVIACIQAALRHDQMQPWMYEAIGLAMQLDGRDLSEIERAIMSAVDFVELPDDLMSIADYLTDIGLEKRAITLYKHVAKAAPDLAGALPQGPPRRAADR